jgi:hypothetical protein
LNFGHEDSPSADHGAFANLNSTGQCRSRRDMREVADSAIVLYDCAGVDYDVRANCGVNLYACPRTY